MPENKVIISEVTGDYYGLAVSFEEEGKVSIFVFDKDQTEEIIRDEVNMEREEAIKLRDLLVERLK